MGVPKYRIELTQQEREKLLRITRRHTEKQSVVRRAQIILMADEGSENQAIAAQLGVNVHVVSTWTKRWLVPPAQRRGSTDLDAPPPQAT
jgi:DNA-binding NarL/FixJ family response regulator